MFRMFDRHAQRPNRWECDDSVLYRGEWFEIGEASHDYMFEILPQLWIKAEMFAMRECLTDSVTSIFFTLSIDGRIRRVHGYCDLADKGSPERMAGATITTIRPCSSATARIARLISLSLSSRSGPSPASSIPSTGLRRSGNVIARGWRSTSGGFPRIRRGRVVSSPLPTNCLRSARSCVRSRRPWRNPLAMTLRCRASRPSPLLLTQRLDQVAYVLVAIFRR
ncbi:DUF1419 domain-containing protein [Sinorhizobium meliloti]|uniref:DUF1419 domain-containing protein n=1 Tax=Rhizobium meliloti TaxID=382 RepID=UPI0023805530|nr:DUF1419 domain-containing protein [Sinorhizobium meliloti]